jgi:hypothetical protein
MHPNDKWTGVPTAPFVWIAEHSDGALIVGEAFPGGDWDISVAASDLPAFLAVAPMQGDTEAWEAFVR